MLAAPGRVGLAVFAAGLSTTLPLPLYAEYAAGAGAGPLAAAFACYAAVLILTAPLLGPLPDRIGRRACMMAGLALTGGSTLLLALWPGLLPLALARLLQGLGMGCVANAAGAWAAELAEREGSGTEAASRLGAGVVTTGTALSFGTGSLLTLLALLAAPDWRPPVVFWAHLALIGTVLALLAPLPETLPAPRGGWLRLPLFPRGTLAGSLGMLPAWGLTGVVLTTIPATLAAAGQGQAGAWAVALMILVGAATQQALRRVAPRPALLMGLPVLVLGSGLAITGTLSGMLWLLLLGGAVLGTAAYGFVYLGGLALAAAGAPQERPRAIAGFFVIAHLGFSAVPLTVGFLADAVGTAPALMGLWGAVALFCGVLWLRLR
ncbi:MFS transporter [Roseococcus microcysteis]|uniref:MFS transporter n=1 Tax=Roseococcus microcysteis TaxID=2771361 RepID=UPI00168B0AF8|nr:MFS transporter [Roseococcus microcysteis]